MKPLYLIITLLWLGLLTEITTKVTAQTSEALPDCPSSLLNILILNPDLLVQLNCDAEKFVKNELCHHQIGRIYLKVPLPINDIRFVRLENSETFWTSQGKGDLGDNVIVKIEAGKQPQIIRTSTPKWIDQLSGTKSSELSITKMIENYLKQTDRQNQSVKDFCDFLK